MSSLHNVFCSSAMELIEICTKYVHGNRLAALMHVHRLWYTWSSKLNTNIQQSSLLPARDTQDSDRQCVTAHVSVGLSPDVATSETAQDQRHTCHSECVQAHFRQEGVFALTSAMLSAHAILMRSTVAGLSKGKSMVAPQSLLQTVTSHCVM